MLGTKIFTSIKCQYMSNKLTRKGVDTSIISDSCHHDHLLLAFTIAINVTDSHHVSPYDVLGSMCHLYSRLA